MVVKVKTGTEITAREAAAIMKVEEGTDVVIDDRVCSFRPEGFHWFKKWLATGRPLYWSEISLTWRGEDGRRWSVHCRPQEVLRALSS